MSPDNLPAYLPLNRAAEQYNVATSTIGRFTNCPYFSNPSNTSANFSGVHVPRTRMRGQV
jgi:hypothetical protein